ncbi:sce7725 family protein [Burkholderia vietnamiensis]|uniref:Sce7725 family protein n=1 Tax=Burkholderia vietnamiensis TaxID=60552 RepID=A0AAW7TCV8_BURVI|nr:sce7725 family protein [Burkholderia vietnamiensis]MDN7799350.1 sce7725 family protein [Burkholderia vietnamiensis]
MREGQTLYFPYLYARQSELLALRSLRGNYQLREVVIPILEPVNNNPARLRQAINDFGDADDNLIVITNPYQHEFHSRGLDGWIEPIEAAIDAHDSLIPGLLCSQATTAEQIRDFLAQYRNRDVALLYLNARLSDAQVQRLAERANIRFHVNLHERMSAAHRAMLPRGKVVDVRDDFQRKARNADYAGIEFFTDRHLNYRQVAVGFGDYTILGATFEPGGGPAAAVAIHGTFKERGADVWVEHFVSDDVDLNVGTVGEKFLQAAGKLVARARQFPRKFGNDQALQDYANDVAAQHYPGLGKSKERQIYHHVALMHQLLTGQL